MLFIGNTRIFVSDIYKAAASASGVAWIISPKANIVPPDIHNAFYEDTDVIDVNCI